MVYFRVLKIFINPKQTQECTFWAPVPSDRGAEKAMENTSSQGNQVVYFAQPFRRLQVRHQLLHMARRGQLRKMITFHIVFCSI